jgi:hypothetical protein
MFPSRDEGLRLHQRLSRHEAQAPCAICQTYLPVVEDHLRRTFPGVDDHLRRQAAHDALLDYVTSPGRFCPDKSDLAQYLCMAAGRDLQNLQRREARHHRLRVSFFPVENGEEGGNVSGREENPLDLLAHDEEAAAMQELLQRVEADCCETDRRVLRLMIERQDSTSACAAALGLGHLSPADQAAEVKRAKDRIKKRIERRRSA